MPENGKKLKKKEENGWRAEKEQNGRSRNLIKKS
jgi:hypothetical protein